jgi:hypothetical protein
MAPSYENHDLMEDAGGLATLFMLVSAAELNNAAGDLTRGLRRVRRAAPRTPSSSNR